MVAMETISNSSIISWHVRRTRSPFSIGSGTGHVIAVAVEVVAMVVVVVVVVAENLQED